MDVRSILIYIYMCVYIYIYIYINNRTYNVSAEVNKLQDLHLLKFTPDHKCIVLKPMHAQ